MTETNMKYITALAETLECTEDEALEIIFTSFRAERRAERLKMQPAPMLPRDEKGKLLSPKELEIYLAAHAMHRIEEARIGDTQRENEVVRVPEELLGPEISDRLADLCKSWGGPIQETLRAAVEFMPMQKKWNQIAIMADRLKKHLTDLEGSNPAAVGVIRELLEYREATKIPEIIHIRTGGN